MKKLALLVMVLGMGILVAQEPAPQQKDNPPVKKEGRRPFGPRGEKGPMGPPSFKSTLEKFDKNKDGAISKDEVEDKMWERMGKADTDKDGKVTEKEFNDYRKSIMEKALGKKRKDVPKDK